MNIQNSAPLDLTPSAGPVYRDELPVTFKRMNNNAEHGNVNWQTKGKTYKELSESFPYGRKSFIQSKAEN